MSLVAVNDMEAISANGPDFDDELLGDLLFGNALMLRGSEHSDEELLRITSETFPARSFCIVRVWMLIDVMLTNRHDSLVRQDGLYPSVLYANAVVYASDPIGDTSHGVLSGFQQRHQDCFFETEEMIYVLAGRGSRKHASVPTVFALSQKCGGNFRRSHV